MSASLTNESSAIIRAIEDFCKRHRNDPNLFPPKQDKVILDNTQGEIISEHPEVTTNELVSMHQHPKCFGVGTARIKELN